MNKRQIQKAETLEDILKVSGELFASQGYEHTSINQIAERCGLSKGALYHHFTSKEEVLDRLCRDHNAMLSASVEPIVRDSSRPPLDRIAEIIRKVRAINMDSSSFVAEYLKVRQGQGNEILKERLRRYDRQLYVTSFGPLLTEARSRGDCAFEGSPEVIAVFIQQLDTACTEEIALLYDDPECADKEAAVFGVLRTFAYALSRLLSADMDAVRKIIGLEDSGLFFGEMNKTPEDGK